MLILKNDILYKILKLLRKGIYVRHKLILLIVIAVILQLVIPINHIQANSNSEVKVNVDVINVRSGPGLSHKLVAQINKNERYLSLEKREDWVKIKLSKSKTGWVASWLVTETTNIQTNQLISSSVNGLNVRTGPGLTFPVLAQIYPSEQFPYVKEEGQWTSIDYKGEKGWVASWLINKSKNQLPIEQPELEESVTVQADFLNIRTGPSTDNKIVGSLKKGQKVLITNVTDGWYKIKFKSADGWIAGEYVKKETESPNNEREETKKGEHEQATVTATVLNVRDNGSLNGKVIDQLSKGTKIQVLNAEGDWSYVGFGNKKGWVASWYLQKESSKDRNEVPIDQTNTPKVTLLHDGTNLRNGPSTKNKILERGNKGDQFPILSKTGDWYKILLPNNKEAYVAGWIVTASNNLAPVKQENVSDYLKGKTIVIDPGHGGRDSGAVGCCNRVLEKDLTLQTAKLLSAKLVSAGATVVLTRKDDLYLSLLFRVSVSNYYNADAFISLHYNSSIYPSAKGIMSFYYNKTQEKVMADVIQKELIKGTGLRDRGVHYGNYQVLRSNRQPSILLELGFLSNPEEEYLVKTKSYQEKVSEAIYLGLGRYYENRK
jgi:N-acetylmuramoyl-L-alanine amidase